MDISSTTNLVEVGSVDMAAASQDIWSVSVSGNYAYIADSYGGLQIIDVSDPASPVFPTGGTNGNFDTDGTAYEVYVSGNYAYMADWDNGLQIIDVTDPASPVLPLGGDGNYTPGTSWVNGVYVSGNYAYVSNCNTGGSNGALHIININT